MQTSTDQGKQSDTSLPLPADAATVPAKDREEDSGLHDIRSLAQSTKMRLSQNMIAARAPTHDDDILSTSSGAWKAVALPEPAKMVSLPEISELPTKKEIKARAAAEKKAVAVEASIGATAAPAVTPIGARIAAKPAANSNTMKIVAFAGIGVAAAAGIAFFVINRGGSSDNKSLATAPSVVAITEIKPAAPVDQAAMIPPPPAAEAARAEDKTPDTGMAAGSAAPAPTPPTAVAAVKAPAKGTSKAVGSKKDDPGATTKDAAPVDKQIKDGKGKKEGKPGDADPNFDDLLNEAGVDKTKKVVAPKLDKKSLSSGDIKTGMNGVAGVAAACYSGTQGTAGVHLTVTPDGKVKAVNVTGVFAGTPVAACVAAAVRGASFPAWDGGPQSFNYSYLLQEK